MGLLDLSIIFDKNELFINQWFFYMQGKFEFNWDNHFTD